ncbi:MAG: trigger factor [Bacillota bacterium]
MKVSAEKIDGSKVVLTVEAPASVVDEALEKAYKSVVKRVNVPGFRRGKAPRFILERHYGKEVLYDEAMKEVLPAQYIEAVKETKIDPVDDPEFDDVNFKQGEPLTFKATVYVTPEVQLSDYSDLSVAYEAPTVEDSEVDGQVSYLRERMAELRPLEEGQAIEAGDLVTVHVKGIDGGNFKAEIDQDFPYAEAGRENALVPGLGDALIGMKKGETKEFTGTYPVKPAEEAPKEDGAKPEGGDKPEEAKAPSEPEQPKEAKFAIEVKEIRRKHYPSDEDFLKNLSKETLDEVREDLKTRLLAIKTDSAKRVHSDKVEDALLGKATVEIPPPMIAQRQQELFERFVQRVQSAGADVNQYLRSTGRTPDEIASDFATQAEREVKRDLVLDAVSAKEGIKASEEAVNSVIEALAREAGKDVQAVKTTLELRGALKGIEQNLTRVEALNRIAVLAAQKAGTPLPEDKPLEKPKASSDEPEAKTEEAEAPQKEEPANPEGK